MSRTLFWEEQVPGNTQLVAAIVGSESIGTVKFYEIQSRVTTLLETGTESRTWSVRRRYSEFRALHKILNHLGFPCPSLPPKQLWGGHTNAFMANRQNALNCWIKGVVIIWQSCAPSRPRAAFAIGELLEAFLCAPDSESFRAVLEEVQNEEKVIQDQEPDIEAQLPALSEGAEIEPAPLPVSPFVSHVAAGDKNRSGSWTPQNGAATTKKTTTYAQVAHQSWLRSKRASGTSVIVEDQASSFSDMPSLHRDKAANPSKTDDKISRSAPPEHANALLAQSMPTYLPELIPPAVPSASAVGFAVNMAPSSSPDALKQRMEYVTFDNNGNRVRNLFQPFTAKVLFGEGPEGKEEIVRTSGLLDACTPVSVPPSPLAQHQFNAQWNQYTSSVLEFVQERLRIVAKNKERLNFNILDRHNPGSDGGAMYLSDYEEEENTDPISSSAKPMTVINLREKGSTQASDTTTTESVEDADAGAGGSTQGGQLPPQQALFASYALAGEHLIRTILKEAEADLVDWHFVENTRDVIVMRRLRPIKKRSLLRLQGPSVQYPSPSPNLDDRNRGTVAPAPSALTLDGAMSAASPMASPMPGTNGTPKEQDSQHCFMGRGIIDASAEEIFELVRRPEKRHLYDAMLNEELLLENLAIGDSAHEFEISGTGNLLVYYHLFETNRCFLRYARDFCVMQYAKKVTIGRQVKYVVVGASINHPSCPVREDVERATLDLFGWVVEPTAKPNQSKVTYMMHIDFGRSGVPTHLLNTISFRQPLSVHYVRRYILSIPPEQRLEMTKQQEALKKESLKKESTKKEAGAKTEIAVPPLRVAGVA